MSWRRGIFLLGLLLSLHSAAFAGSLTIGPGVMIGNNDLQYSSVLFDRLAVNSSGNLTIGATEKAPGAATAALAGLGAGNVNSGTHSYKITFVTAGGETDAGAVSGTVTTTAGDGQVALSAIPTGSVFVTSRKVYRTAAGNAVTGPWLLLATVADNTTTTYADNTADASLTTASPTANTAIDTRWTFKNSGVFDTANTAPSFTLTDTTASAKSLTIAVDANLAQLRESAGASGSLLVLDLANNRVGIGTATPNAKLNVNGTLLVHGTNTNNAPSSVLAALELFTGRSSTGALNSGQTIADVAFNYGGTGGGYRHWIATKHSSTADSGNGIEFFVNNSASPATSSVPGTGNIRVLGLYGTGNVGIGTTNPVSFLLQVAGNIGPNANGASDLGNTTLGFKRLYMDYTNTATIGAVTINKASFRANVALGATSVVVTNSLVTAASKVLCVAAQNDTTGRVTATVPGAGTVTVHSIATTANMAVDCMVINAD